MNASEAFSLAASLAIGLVLVGLGVIGAYLVVGALFQLLHWWLG